MDALNVVVAEDDLVTRRMIEKFLRADGHRVQTFADGRGAWRYIEANEVNVVVSDWMMPDGDGLDLCRRVREMKREDYTYFILLTSMSRNKENIRTAAAAGVDDFLTKPVNPDDLWMRLRVADRILRFQGQVRQLESLIPICSYCKKVRDDSNLWQAVDKYLSEQTGRDLSHSICPDCYEKVVKAELEELAREREQKENGRAEAAGTDAT